jgi:hypothetical protein
VLSHALVSAVACFSSAGLVSAVACVSSMGAAPESKRDCQADSDM